VDAAGPWDPDFRVSGDWDFVLRALEHARVAGDCRVALSYRRHPDSVTRSADRAMGDTARALLTNRYFDRHPHQRGTLFEQHVRMAWYFDRGKARWRGAVRRARGLFPGSG
jgi:hypothetical protein